MADPLEALPLEVVFEVIEFLTVGEVATCRAVCHAWNSLFSDPLVWRRIRVTKTSFGGGVAADTDAFVDRLAGGSGAYLGRGLRALSLAEADSLSLDGVLTLTSAFPRLESLNLSLAYATPREGFDNLSRLTSLTHLNLSYCSQLDADALDRLAALTALCVFDMCGCAGAGIPPVRAWPRLRSLAAVHSSIDAVEMVKAIAEAPCAAVIQAIDLADVAVVVGDGLAALPSLSRLSVGRMDDDPEEVVDRAGRLPGLVPGLNTLHTDGMVITPAVTAAVFAPLQSLTSLSLTRSEVDRAEVFVDLMHTVGPRLRRLAVVTCRKFGDLALDALLEAARGGLLTELTLYGVGITDDGMLSIATWPGLLSRLCVDNCPYLTRSGWRLLFGGGLGRHTVVDMSFPRESLTGRIWEERYVSPEVMMWQAMSRNAPAVVPGGGGGGGGGLSMADHLLDLDDVYGAIKDKTV